MMVLSGVSGPYAGAQFTLADGDSIVGRNPTCQISLPNDQSVSGSHLRLRVSGSSVTYQDLGSSNGTFVNSQRVQTGTLSAGDDLQLGTSVFRVLTQQGATAPLCATGTIQTRTIPSAPPPVGLQTPSQPNRRARWRRYVIAVGTVWVLLLAIVGAMLLRGTSPVSLRPGETVTLQCPALHPILAGLLREECSRAIDEAKHYHEDQRSVADLQARMDALDMSTFTPVAVSEEVMGQLSDALAASDVEGVRNLTDDETGEFLSSVVVLPNGVHALVLVGHSERGFARVRIMNDVDAVLGWCPYTGGKVVWVRNSDLRRSPRER